MNINDLQFSPKPTDYMMKAAKTFLETSENFGSTANYAVLNDEGGKKEFTVKPCHWDIGYPVMRAGDRAGVATEIATKRAMSDVNKKTRKVFIPYMKWLCQDSFFSRFILNGDDLDYCIDNGIIVSADMPVALLQNIMIMSRHPFEVTTEGFKLFNRLLKDGYPGSAAFSLSMLSNFSIRTGECRDDPLVISKTTHRAWALWRSMRSFKNFIRGEFGDTLTNDKKHHYRHYATIRGGSAFCTDPDDTVNKTFVLSLLNKDEEFRETLARHRHKGKKTISTVVINPFKRPAYGQPAGPASPDQVKMSEMLEVVYPYLKEKGFFDDAAC